MCLQGDLSQQDKRCVFVTVHDLGTNREYLKVPKPVIYPTIVTATYAVDCFFLFDLMTEPAC